MQLKKLIRCLLVITLSISPSLSTAEETLEAKHNIIVTPFTGYRYDVFQWSLPLHGIDTNRKISELTWKNHIFESGIQIETKPEEKEFNFLGQIKYGYILSNSTSQDSDWDDIGEYARSFSSVKGNILDLSGAVGISQAFKNTLVTYYLGMDYNKYQTKSYGLDYKINRLYHGSIGVVGGDHPKSQLVSKYKFDNYAPWIGASIDYAINDKFSIIPTVKLYLFYLSGEADWVLRDEYKHNPSFTHKAFGVGGSFDTKISYKYNKNLALKASVGIKKFTMKQGREKLFYSDNSFLAGYTGKSDLKKLSLFSSYLSAGIIYKL